MKRGVISTVLFFLAVNVGFAQEVPKRRPPFETMVWMDNERGMKSHRILGLTMSQAGVLLAFTEARHDGSDEGPHDLVCKRSLDNGTTWPSEIIIEKGDGSFWTSQGELGKLESWANPVAVTDRTNGRVFIFYVLNEGEYKGYNTQRMTRVFYRYSDDEGLTWGERVEITDVLNVGPDGKPHVDLDGEAIKNRDGFACDYLGRAFHMPGPGHGIQLANGRLIIQFWHRRAIGRVGPDGTHVTTPISDRLYGSSVVYSDDHGRNWTKGNDTGLGHRATEARVVELADGTVMLNARMHNKGRRWVARSHDGGETWQDAYEERTVMPYTAVDCGLIRVQPPTAPDSTADWLLHSHPNKVDKREGLTVSLSMDGGRTWPVSKLLYGYGAQYSDLIQLKDGTIGLLYEKKNNHPGSTLGGGISFVRFELDWLIDNIE